jgi:hypothetical protein
MILHTLSPEFPCPLCGAAKLAYSHRRRTIAEIYVCRGCGCHIAHRRLKGESRCQTAIALGFSYGVWRPCPSQQGADGEIHPESGGT